MWFEDRVVQIRTRASTMVAPLEPLIPVPVLARVPLWGHIVSDLGRMIPSVIPDQELLGSSCVGSEGLRLCLAPSEMSVSIWIIHELGRRVSRHLPTSSRVLALGWDSHSHCVCPSPEVLKNKILGILTYLESRHGRVQVGGTRVGDGCSWRWAVSPVRLFELLPGESQC